MLDAKPLNKLIYIDIETTSQHETLASCPELVQKLFTKRYKRDIDENALSFISNGSDLINGVTGKTRREEFLERLYNVKSPLSPEFGKIVCISIGTLTIPTDPQGDYMMSIHSFSNENEKKLLEDFIKRTASVMDKLIPEYALVTYNGNAFDIPFIAKRVIINRLPLPRLLDYGDKKPWDLVSQFVDVKTVWGMGAWGNDMVSLDCLCNVMGVESSKDTMDGSMVKDMFWVNKDLPAIVSYCERDVVALSQVYLKLKNLNNNVVIKTK